MRERRINGQYDALRSGLDATAADGSPNSRAFERMGEKPHFAQSNELCVEHEVFLDRQCSLDVIEAESLELEIPSGNQITN